MVKPRGFDELFEDEIAKNITYEEAYEALEAEYIAFFGQRRYSNYESYRKARARRIKNPIYA